MKRTILYLISITVVVLLLGSIPSVRRATLYTFEDATYAMQPSADYAYKLGNKYFNESNSGYYDLKRARHFYFLALDLNPEHPTVLMQLARTSFVDDDLESALLQIDLQLAKHPNISSRAYYIRALIYGYQKRFDKASEDFERYITLEPRKWYAHNDLAWSYVRESKFDKALTAIDGGLALAPQNAWLLISQSVILYELGRYDEAYEIALKGVTAAEKVTPDEWRAMYPGNDPALASKGVEGMIASSLANLKRIETKRAETE